MKIGTDFTVIHKLYSAINIQMNLSLTGIDDRLPCPLRIRRNELASYRSERKTDICQSNRPNMFHSVRVRLFDSSLAIHAIAVNSSSLHLSNDIGQFS